MKRLVAIVLSFGLLALAGCASEPVKPMFAETASQSLAPPPDDKAQIVFLEPINSIQGLFPVNVPYMFDMFTWWPANWFYKVLVGADGGEAVVFKPREWRGVNKDSDPFYISPQKMAAEIGGHPKGTVTWVYMTSDGGLSLENSFMALVKLLPPHVQIVGADTATKLALAAGHK